MLALSRAVAQADHRVHPVRQVAGMTGVPSAVALSSAWPYLEELVRGIRARGASADASAPQRAASARPAAR